nr:WecB/TagA/CpsF family glycosyltransferase [Aquiflexum gelatinilyticum]
MLIISRGSFGVKNEIQKIWGINFLLTDQKDYLAYLENCLSSENRIILNGVNPYSLSLVKKNPEILDALKQSTIANVDGILLKFALQYLGYKVPVRLDTPSIFEGLMEICVKQKFSIFLLGSKEEELPIIIDNLKNSFKDLNIVGSHNGFFSAEDDHQIIENIKNCSPDIILLGMPSPKKEVFMYKNKDKFLFKASLGVGGVFDIIAGKKKQAPIWVKDLKIEWLYRFVQEPFRLFERYLDMFLYFFKFIWDSRETERKRNS